MTPNLRGSALMTAAMAGVAVEDMFLKAAARHMPQGQSLVVFGLAGAAVFALLALRAGERPLHPAMVSPVLLVRSAFEVAGRLFWVLAITLTPLSESSAILQATPLVVMAAAGLLFHERITPSRWLAVLVGFAGVLLILRPGLQGFSLLSLLAVAALIGFAGRDVATRAAPRVLSNRQLGVVGFAALTVAGLLLMAWQGTATVPGWTGLGLVLGAAVVGVAAYLALTAAMRTGEVSVVTPFRYTRLVFGMLLGIVVFAERPDALTLVGAALVVGAGLITLARSARG